MKKILKALLIVVCIIALCGCDGGGKIGVEEYQQEKKILALVSNYELSLSNGYNFVMEQKYNGNVVNSHSVSVCFDNANNLGYKFEYEKRLNEDIANGQYSETYLSSYYKDGKVATEQDGKWIWTDCQLDTFADVNISSFVFNILDLQNMQLTTDVNSVVLSFSIPDAKANRYLKVSDKSVKNLKFEVMTDLEMSNLVSFKMSYSQEKTTFEYCFVPYLGEVDIQLPQ